MNFMINNNHMAVVKLLLEKMKSPEYKNVLRNDKIITIYFRRLAMQSLIGVRVMLIIYQNVLKSALSISS